MPTMKPPLPLGTDDITDGEREREFFRYYQRTRPAPPIIPPYARSSSTRSLESQHSLVATDAEEHLQFTPDPTLTAFAQLGLLKLKASRALVTFFSRKRSYVLAEATAGTSLNTAENLSGNPEDELCWGSHVGGKGLWVCETTVKLPTVFEKRRKASSLSGEPPELRDVTSLIIPDLSKDERFKDRPYVVGAPHARFYAGVPIRSPAGHSIGAFCVLDGVPRPKGVTEEELICLKDVASAVMRHLELSKNEEFSRRMQKMVGGLGAFIEGRGDSPTFGSGDPMGRSSISLRSSSSTASSSISKLAMTPESEGSVDAPSTGASSAPSQTDIREKKPPHDRATPDDVHATFRRASKALRKATDVDGAIFFDASITTFGGLVDDPTSPKARRSSTFLTTRNADKPCAILGSSYSEPLQEPSSKHLMTEQSLKGLLSRYPRGRIFNFDTTPRASPTSLTTNVSQLDIDTFTLSSLVPGANSLILLPLCVFDHTSARPFAAALLWTCDRERMFRESEELAYLTAFSNSIMAELARCDAARRDRAKADFISGISHELRSPLHGILGCVELMLGEDEGQQSQNDADAAGDDDGAGASMSPWHIEMARTIETCSRTLLDTINHVLDFAKINNVTRDGMNDQLRRPGGSTDGGSSGSSKPSIVARGYEDKEKDHDALKQDVDLASLAEEVVETVYAGYKFRRRSKVPVDIHDTADQQQHQQQYGRMTGTIGMAPFQPSAVVNPFAAGETAAEQNGVISEDCEGDEVKVILEIGDPLRSGGWDFKTQPGAWRRILMNLFGNSLKYTDSGFIRVKLDALHVDAQDAKNAAAAENHAQIMLTVADSGRGMSRDYLRDHLFHPFAQEDPLSPGTGLGLSITRQIVAAMGGRIDVSSEKGKGTEFSIIVDLERAAAGMKSAAENMRAAAVRGRTVALVGFTHHHPGAEEQHGENPEPNQVGADALLYKSMNRMCENWFGLQCVDLLTKPDLYIATEKALHSGTLPDDVPAIGVCQSAVRHAGRMSNRDTRAATTKWVMLPCGPKRLAKAVQACFATTPSAKSTGTPTPMTSSLNVSILPVRGLPTEISNLSIEPRSRTSTPPMSLHAKTPSIPMFTPNSMRPLEAAVSQVSEGESPPPLPLSRLVQGASASLPTIFSSADESSKLSDHRLRKHLQPVSSGNKLNVLIVDDSSVNLKLLEAFMKRKGYTYSTASNGLEAVNVFKASETQFDFVLMDITMPVMDGLSATRLIRAHENNMREDSPSPGTEIPSNPTDQKAFKAAKIVALTGLANQEAKNEAFTSGIDMFVTKPVRLAELSKILDSNNDNKTKDSGLVAEKTIPTSIAATPGRTA